MCIKILPFLQDVSNVKIEAFLQMEYSFFITRKVGRSHFLAKGLKVPFKVIALEKVKKKNLFKGTLMQI